MKHFPFLSNYRPDFQVVEERRGRTRSFPHTEQLPVLWRALNLEFLGPLPPKIARVDKRADGFHKIMRRTATLMFCAAVNQSREDALRLYGLVDYDLVSRVSVVQQISEETRRGLCHRFRFYAGDEFQPEIFLSGKRVVFSDHVMQRFCLRAPHRVGTDMTFLLHVFFGSPVISFPAAPGRAFLFNYQGSILAFTYEETESEYIVTTCLTINELHSLSMEMPTPVHSFHYDPEFTEPKLRNWFTTGFMRKLFLCWERKAPFRELSKPRDYSWSTTAARLKDLTIMGGHGPGSTLLFLDGVRGPSLLALPSGKPENWYDEMAAIREAHPDLNWDAEVPATAVKSCSRRPQESLIQ